MPGPASFFRRTLFSDASRRGAMLRPSEHTTGRANVPPDPPDDEATARDRWSRTSAERLEHIAMYARAGYFNLGYTYDMFHLAAELPPE
ncbi:hypothetical protein [Paraburkholderia humisilvae]|uniref:Uncharacterized protein n=1 Tax=Paraburkholderia humisilvae TaxID=627669 RepID=A0A6J5E4K8_9BURK|nr:hypothetical protein [Paraburkholderia humisilvae]CAB3761350.1 hypothetical protein LMG29542_04056 [Paraburkholderia humisilvae]